MGDLRSGDLNSESRAKEEKKYKKRGKQRESKENHRKSFKFK